MKRNHKAMSIPEADLYLNQINLRRYCLAENTLSGTNYPSDIKTERTCVDACPLLTPQQRQAFKIVVEAKEYLPSLPLTTIPQPVEPDLLPINTPDENALVIVSGNSRLTFEVLATVWAQGITPAYFLLLDCLGQTVDMAMVLGTFTPEQLVHALKKNGLEGIIAHRHMIVPGLTSPLAEAFIKATSWEVEVGPVCAAELPLFLGDRWIFPDLS